MFTISQETLTQHLDILWEPVGQGIRILRVYGEHPCLSLPETIDGKPVTEIGPYCFSRSEPKLPEVYFHHIVGDTRPLSSLSGSSVETIFLPSTVTTLHNAAFYNCRMLHTLSVGPDIRSIGSDEFTNCTKLRHLLLRCDDSKQTGLPLLLERIADDLHVSFVSSENTITSTLLFPEYYEWLDEISPAHIFSRSIHGEGFRMRKCFENNQLNYEKYDSCFENALKVESKETICHIAFYRLYWHHALKEDAKLRYEEALKHYLTTAIDMSIREKDLSFLLFLCPYFSGTDDYTYAISSCIHADWSEGSARLMEEKHRNGTFAKKDFSFEDF